MGDIGDGSFPHRAGYESYRSHDCQHTVIPSPLEGQEKEEQNGWDEAPQQGLAVKRGRWGLRRLAHWDGRLRSGSLRNRPLLRTALAANGCLLFSAGGFALLFTHVVPPLRQSFAVDQCFEQGHKQNSDIESQCPMLNIENIVLDTRLN